MKDYLFTSESVTEGHPDKVADQISDGILDEALKQDPLSRVACETLVKTGLVVIAGEITTNAKVNYAETARRIIKEIGYTSSDIGFDYRSCGVIVSIEQQSPDIAMGVDREGAGDQGLMFGYAINETEELMPLPIMLAHKLVQRLTEARKNNELSFLRPDGKSQVTVEYRDNKPVRVDSVVISAQHSPEIEVKDMRDIIIEKIIKSVIPEQYIDKNTKFFINPTGRFVIGGPQGDCGLTGRKIMVDTYGGMGHHGGGCFSGKDPTKVDRSASYMARYVAKNIVASGIADKCEIQLAYVIGVVEPVSIAVDTFGTGKFSDEEIAKMVKEVFDLTPKGMIEKLQLRRPIYRKTAAYGHFGRSEPEFLWEKTDAIEEIKRYFNL